MDPANRGKSRDGRFLEKVFLREERESIRSSADPDAALWALWAAKEAAWKAAVKAAPEDRRGWKGIRIRTDGGLKPGGGEIFAGSVPAGGEEEREPSWTRVMAGVAETFAGDVSFLVDRRGGCIHAVGLLGAADPAERVVWQALDVRASAAFPERPDPSSLGRSGLIRHLNILLGLEEGEAAIRRDAGPRGLLPPRLFILDEPSRIDISLSHDGRFTAWALLAASKKK